ncbi:hypothetical protein F2Q69_00039030 [Brassica cretica]|uniref:Uncharacterized protein n=1 Tax=Brassica cretica TaxID=69181 RepID=A0A8S9SLD1_BRACR|nr:hypothetical protein F2Q69_00039030 [Brassica cretica]
MDPFPLNSTGFVNMLASQSSPPIDVDSAEPGHRFKGHGLAGHGWEGVAGEGVFSLFLYVAGSR